MCHELFHLRITFWSQALTDYCLKRTLGQGPMIGLYWLKVHDNLLSEAQHGHEVHAPFHIAVEITGSAVKF
jgi:hypothetical protein